MNYTNSLATLGKNINPQIVYENVWLVITNPVMKEK